VVGVLNLYGRRSSREDDLMAKKMSVKQAIADHDGHDLSVASYGQGDDTYNIALECETCWTILLDKDVHSSDDADDLADKYREEAGIL
jgi:hypothetical protein